MNYPLVSVVLTYAVGLLLARYFPVSPLLLLPASFCVLALALIFDKLRPHLLWPLLALLGWSNYAVQTQVISPHDLRRLLPNEPRIVTVRGVLRQTPSQRVYVRNGTEIKRTLVPLKAIALTRDGNRQPATGEVMVTARGSLPGKFFQGQTVDITGVIAPPPIPVAEGLFNYRSFLRDKGIYFQLKTDSLADWQLLSTNRTPPFSDRFRAWARNTLARGLPTTDEPVRLLWAMSLGWRTALTGEVATPFRESGTIHIFAISGLHIALIAGILMAILRAVRLPRFVSGAMIIPLLWSYTAATGWQPSAIRSTIMMTIVIGGWMLKRPGNLLNSLAAAALAILLCDPRQLFQASFQLSFFVVLSIALFMPPLEKWRDRLLQTDPLLPRDLLPRWRRWLNSGFRLVLTWLAVSVAAWLGSWPLCAYYFHLFSPITLLANVCIVPLASAALACNLGSLICGAWLPCATILFNHSAWFWMTLMLNISHAMVKWPFAFFYVRSPSLMDVGFYYAALFVVVSGLIFKRAWRIPLLLCLLLFAGFCGWRWQESRQTTTLTVLPLSGGSAVFVQDAKSNNLLVDCGNSNAVEFVTAPFLHAHGVNHLPRLALTQGDVHDMGGALEICDDFSVNHTFTSGVQFRSHIYREIVNTLDQKPENHIIVNRGDSIGKWRVLYPGATNNFARADDESLVLQGEIHGLKILMVSDLGRDGQEVLFNQTNDLRADIIIAGLPTQSEALCNALPEKNTTANHSHRRLRISRHMPCPGGTARPLGQPENSRHLHAPCRSNHHHGPTWEMGIEHYGRPGNSWPLKIKMKLTCRNDR